MGLWTFRKTLYKVGVVGQYVGFFLFVGGFSAPYWFYASPSEGSQGLWQYCNGRCHQLEVEEDWLETARVLLCITLIVYLAACVLAVYDNCLTKYDPVLHRLSRRIEVTTAVAGLMGASGLAVYTVMMKMQYQEYSKNYFGGAYYVTAASCLLALVVAVVLSATGFSLIQNCVVLSPGQNVVVTYQSTSSRGVKQPMNGRVVRSGSAGSPVLYTPVFTQAVTPSYFPTKLHTGTHQAYPAPSATNHGYDHDPSETNHANYHTPSITDHGNHNVSSYTYHGYNRAPAYPPLPAYVNEPHAKANNFPLPSAPPAVPPPSKGMM